jgi:hypothetical protein
MCRVCLTIERVVITVCERAWSAMDGSGAQLYVYSLCSVFLVAVVQRRKCFICCRCSSIPIHTSVIALIISPLPTDPSATTFPQILRHMSRLSRINAPRTKWSAHYFLIFSRVIGSDIKNKTEGVRCLSSASF